MRNIVVLHPNALDRWLGMTPRFIKMAKGLSQCGWEMTIVKVRSENPTDRQVESAFPGKVIRVPYRYSPYPFWFDFKGGRRSFRFLFQLLGKPDPLFDPRRGWPRRLARHSRSRFFRFPIDAVMGVTAGEVRLLYAAKAFAEAIGKPFFLEFRDPVPVPNTELDPFEEKCLEECIAYCSGIITTTVSYAESLKKRYPSCAAKTLPLYASFDDTGRTTAEKTVKDPRLVFLHAGGLQTYAGSERSAEPLLRAFRKAVDLDPSIRGKAVLTLLGGGPGGVKAGEIAACLGIADMVEVRDVVPRDEAIAAMEASDVLVVIKFADPAIAAQIPGKIFEYFGRRKPILGIMDTCEAAELIRGSGLGVTYPHHATEQIANYLVRYASKPDQLTVDFEPNDSFISQFSTAAMAERLATFLEEKIR